MYSLKLLRVALQRDELAKSVFQKGKREERKEGGKGKKKGGGEGGGEGGNTTCLHQPSTLRPCLPRGFSGRKEEKRGGRGRKGKRKRLRPLLIILLSLQDSGSVESGDIGGQWKEGGKKKGKEGGGEIVTTYFPLFR